LVAKFLSLHELGCGRYCCKKISGVRGSNIDSRSAHDRLIQRIAPSDSIVAPKPLSAMRLLQICGMPSMRRPAKRQADRGAGKTGRCNGGMKCHALTWRAGRLTPRGSRVCGGLGAPRGHADPYPGRVAS
jgi:hypothetical protein